MERGRESESLALFGFWGFFVFFCSFVRFYFGVEVSYFGADTEVVVGDEFGAFAVVRVELGVEGVEGYVGEG